MAPIRRYLRITKHSVLECRIFLENPADGPRWLLNTNDPALPRVIEAVKPYVLPKLREENERLKDKGKKKRTVKDVVKKDDFEVSIFLTEIGTRHTLMVKQKTAVDVGLSNNDKSSSSSSSSRAVAQTAAPSTIIREESDDEDVNEVQIRDAPEASGDEIYSVDSNDGNEHVQSAAGRHVGDKKKLGFNTRYDGFNIWGFVLCLLVERKGSSTTARSEEGHAQALMEEWISTQQEQRDET